MVKYFSAILIKKKISMKKCIWKCEHCVYFSCNAIERNTKGNKRKYSFILVGLLNPISTCLRSCLFYTAYAWQPLPAFCPIDVHREPNFLDWLAVGPCNLFCCSLKQKHVYPCFSYTEWVMTLSIFGKVYIYIYLKDITDSQTIHQLST